MSTRQKINISRHAIARACAHTHKQNRNSKKKTRPGCCPHSRSQPMLCLYVCAHGAYSTRWTFARSFNKSDKAFGCWCVTFARRTRDSRTSESEKRWCNIYVKWFFFSRSPTKSIDGLSKVHSPSRPYDDNRSAEVNVKNLPFQNPALHFSLGRRTPTTDDDKREIASRVLLWCWCSSLCGIPCVEKRGAQNIQNGRRLFMFINTRDEWSGGLLAIAVGGKWREKCFVLELISINSLPNSIMNDVKLVASFRLPLFRV